MSFDIFVCRFIDAEQVSLEKKTIHDVLDAHVTERDPEHLEEVRASLTEAVRTMTSGGPGRVARTGGGAAWGSAAHAGTPVVRSRATGVPCPVRTIPVEQTDRMDQVAPWAPKPTAASVESA
ncbi:hypothetical protein [Streptomyces sp. NBC_00212]|uniref:hypothetical protein n=1 Tax=Streptomyces sp. NBC_00212 TaxID=2975684 RepID=UPI003252EC95